MSVTTAAACKNCGQSIVFQPYFLDGKEPNPPIWWHTYSGTWTCSSRSAEWAVEHPDGWPAAEPPDAPPDPPPGVGADLAGPPG